ncbi:unnamed protein product [Bursaphelenchus okinawaensis]|uniref:Uncharacterized protein n=1 Tax=Bursaphelenchus okinawaensis TaxID=465554 RepID=A0A811KDJ7_9BILA|nr:unnamed protein product [Bursaphelenchus okinawaensis]CAG9101614.1 unnamed protein product [Bursaphelenchus okinawaensis]
MRRRRGCVCALLRRIRIVMTSPPKDSEDVLHVDEPEVSESDFANFIDHQIERLIKEERARSPELTTMEELNIAVAFCKRFLTDTNTDHEKRTQVMAKLVDLKLEQDQVEAIVAA